MNLEEGESENLGDQAEGGPAEAGSRRRWDSGEGFGRGWSLPPGRLWEQRLTTRVESFVHH